VTELTTYKVNSSKLFKTSIMSTMQADAEPSAWYNHDDECPRFRLVAIQWEDGRTTVGTITDVETSYAQRAQLWHIASSCAPGVVRAGENNQGNQVFYWDCSNPDHYVKHVATAVHFGPMCAHEVFDADVWAAWQKRWQS